jgi:membrane-bound serine protease (ClpP class)
MKIFFVCWIILQATFSWSQNITVISIADEVDLGMATYVKRAVQEAEVSRSIILLHVNTFGGRVDAATQIRDAIINAKVPMTIAFVDKRAISAGALITIAAQKIVMAPGASLGAVTPVDMEGTKASEKVVSYMRAEMRATAERNNRNPKIAEAMVDESLGVDSLEGMLLESGKLLTLTTKDAITVGYCDAEASSIEQALAAFYIKTPIITNSSELIGDKIIRFLTLPLVSSILIMIGLGGLFFSIKTGHFGSITAVALLSLALFFGGQYITEVAPTLAAILFIVGLGLIIAELFIPSFGIAGVFGILGITAGLFLALAGDIDKLTPERLRETLLSLAVALIGFFVIAGIIFRFAPGWPLIRKMINLDTSGDISSSVEAQKLLLGKEGIAATVLRPAGSAVIDGRKVDVVTEGEFISAGAPIQIIGISGNRTVVKQTNG